MTNAVEPKSASRTLLFRDGLNEALRQEMARDERVFCIGVGIAERGGSYKVTDGQTLRATLGGDPPVSLTDFVAVDEGVLVPALVDADRHDLTDLAGLRRQVSASSPATAPPWCAN